MRAQRSNPGRLGVMRFKRDGSGGVLVVFLGYAQSFEILGFEHRITIQAPDVVDPVLPCHYFCSLMLTRLHKVKMIPLF